MLELLKLLDTVSYDQKLYWRVMDHKTDAELEIYWNKNEDHQWLIQSINGQKLVSCSSRELLPNLEKLDIDPYEIELRLRRTVLQQVTFADLIISEAVRYFGKATVDEAIKHNNYFMKELESVLENMMNKPKPKLTLLRGQHSEEVAK